MARGFHWRRRWACWSNKGAGSWDGPTASRARWCLYPGQKERFSQHDGAETGLPSFKTTVARPHGGAIGQHWADRHYRRGEMMEAKPVQLKPPWTSNSLAQRRFQVQEHFRFCLTAPVPRSNRGVEGGFRGIKHRPDQIRTYVHNTIMRTCIGLRAEIHEGIGPRDQGLESEVRSERMLGRADIHGTRLQRGRRRIALGGGAFRLDFNESSPPAEGLAPDDTECRTGGRRRSRARSTCRSGRFGNMSGGGSGTAAGAYGVGPKRKTPWRRDKPSPPAAARSSRSGATREAAPARRAADTRSGKIQ